MYEPIILLDPLTTFHNITAPPSLSTPSVTDTVSEIGDLLEVGLRAELLNRQRTF
ncbi:MAG: hypothetical protein RMH84_01545 [Sulfolobales archaeon]|nr:hypothetical protein [Sulfolobales archaeon]MCX8208249.1 hypothetical protein [Sulfolobales archaeon]MDW8010268.1 hypothetical protein [Sulfolobales archaeon]